MCQCVGFASTKVVAHLLRSLVTSVVEVRALSYLFDEISLDGPTVLLTLTDLAKRIHYEYCVYIQCSLRAFVWLLPQLQQTHQGLSHPQSRQSRH
jgi:hypothetical protein